MKTAEKSQCSKKLLAQQAIWILFVMLSGIVMLTPLLFIETH